MRNHLWFVLLIIFWMSENDNLYIDISHLIMFGVCVITDACIGWLLFLYYPLTLFSFLRLYRINIDTCIVSRTCGHFLKLKLFLLSNLLTFPGSRRWGNYFQFYGAIHLTIQINDIAYLSLFWLFCLDPLFYCSQVFLYYLAFQSFDLERTWWRLFQKRVMRTKFDI